MGHVGENSPRGSAVGRGRAVVVAAVMLFIAACNPLSGPGVPGARDLRLAAPVGRVEVGPLTDGGEQIGNGATRIALLVPLTQAAGPAPRCATPPSSLSPRAAPMM
jgi:branched-chain amino acid transport system substrate-binding protein